MATWDQVRKFALSLPGVKETKGRTNAAWVVDDKFFAWVRPLNKSDIKKFGPGAPTGPILGVRTADLEMKEVLLARDPTVYFTIAHFDGYPAVLVRLPKINVKELRDLLEEAWFARAPKKLVKEYLGE
jgi:hypothetical protein